MQKGVDSLGKSRSSIFNPCNLFIGIYCVYMGLSAVESSSITGILMLLIVAISFGYFILINLNMKQPKLLKCLSFLFFWFSLYGIIHILFGRVIHDGLGNLMHNSDYLKNIAVSILPVYPFFYFSRRGWLTLSSLTFWLPIFFCLAAFQFFQFYQFLLQQAMTAGSAVTEFTNNQGYLFVSMLPLLFFCYKRKIIQLLLIGGCAIFIVSSVKRGAILIGGLAIAFFFYRTIFKSKEKGRGKIIFLLICAGLIASYYIVDFINNSDYFSYRLNNTLGGNTSGRDEIYGKIFQIFSQYGIAQLLFGDGAYSTVYYTGLMAHNDWLEILINQGFIGFAIYLYYFITMFKVTRRNISNPWIGTALGGLFIVLFLKTLFSMSYTEYSLFICIAYGYIMNLVSHKRFMEVSHVGRA